MVYSNASASFPVCAITYNHRSEAMYQAIQRDPENVYVKRSLASGLENVRMLSSETPEEVRRLLCNMHNTYHDGTGETWIALLDQAVKLMEEWDEKNNGPEGSGLTTRNSQYDHFLEQFVFKTKQATVWGESLNIFRTTSILNNTFVKFSIKNQIREWCNHHQNFTDFQISNRSGGFWQLLGTFTCISCVSVSETYFFVVILISGRSTL